MLFSVKLMQCWCTVGRCHIASEHMDSQFAQNISTFAVNQFMKSTDGFESNSCLNSKELSITGKFKNSNCYYNLSVAIRDPIELIMKIKTSVIV